MKYTLVYEVNELYELTQQILFIWSKLFKLKNKCLYTYNKQKLDIKLILWYMGKNKFGIESTRRMKTKLKNKVIGYI